MTRATGVLGNIRHQSSTAELNLIPRVSLLQGGGKKWDPRNEVMRDCTLDKFVCFVFFLGFCVALQGKERARTSLVWLQTGIRDGVNWGDFFSNPAKSNYWFLWNVQIHEFLQFHENWKKLQNCLKKVDFWLDIHGIWWLPWHTQLTHNWPIKTPAEG